VRLVADANVLLSALVGGRAQVALTHPSVQAVYAAADTLAEGQEYVSSLAPRSGCRSTSSCWPWQLCQ
jgi:hypothetical protein